MNIETLRSLQQCAPYQKTEGQDGEDDVTTCPFCGHDPFHYVHNGLGLEAVAVDCCELGDLYFRGARPPITEDVVIDPDEFCSLGQRIMGLQNENEAYRSKYGEIFNVEDDATPSLTEAGKTEKTA